MTTWKVFSPSRLTLLRKSGTALLASLLTLVGFSATPTTASFVDSGSARISPVTAATVDLAFNDGGREHTLELDATALGPGDSVAGTLRVFNSGSVDTNLSMSTLTTQADDPSLADYLLLTVASEGLVLSSGPLVSAAFGEGLLSLPAGGSSTAGWVELTITIMLDSEAPVELASQAVDFELNFSSSRATFRVSGTVSSSLSSVAPTTFPISTISVGAQHTFVIDRQGGLWAWGYNNRGQLGDGTAVNRFAPVRVAISEKVEMASAGFDTSIALTSSGRVLTWGNGPATSDFLVEDQLIPTEVSGPWSRVTAVATGGYFFLVLDEDGALWSWGNNGSGRLGHKGSSSGMAHTPGRVTAQSLDTARVTGMHASRFAGMAFTDEGQVIGWGATQNKDSGRTFAGLPPVPVREVAVSDDARVALLQDGRVFTSTGADEFQPTTLANIITVSASAAGSASDKAFVATDGVGLWAWGSNARGQLGLGPGITSVAEPTAVDLSGWGGSAIQSADLGWQHSVIVSTAGNFSSVGTGTHGELGSGTTTFRSFFVGSEEVRAWPGTVPPPITRASRPVSSSTPEVEATQDDEPLDAVTPEADEPHAQTPETDEPEAEGGSHGDGPAEEDLDSGDGQNTPEADDEETPPTEWDGDIPLDSNADEALEELAMRTADDEDARDLLVRMLEAARRADEAETASAADDLARRLDDDGRHLLERISAAVAAPEGQADAARMLDWLRREYPAADTR